MSTASGSAKEERPARPNFLFLMSDEHRPDVAGFAGDEVVRTPTLDWLAEDGVVFTHAYTPSPICVPGRQCMMSGQLPKRNGCEGWVDLPAGHDTFARTLSRHGYATVCCGKLHHHGIDQMQGWTQRPAGDLEVSPDHIEGFATTHEEAGINRVRDVKWSDDKEIKRAGAGRNPVLVNDRAWTDAALHTLERHFADPGYDRPNPQRPIMLKLSLLAPHYPYITDEERFLYYLNRVTPYLDQPVFDHPFLSQRQIRPGIDASERELRRATAAYYGMIEGVDAQFGQVIDMLDQVGQDPDDWIIVYTSDHGEMMGQHGIWEKQKFFDASVRVPLIMRCPDRWRGGRDIEANVSLCDLFATFCDIADVPVPPDLDSRSLLPMLEERDSALDSWPDVAISQFGLHNVMIKRGPLKYQHYGPDMPEVLFDQEKDPGEIRNAINDPEHANAVAWFRQRLNEYQALGKT